MTGSARLGWRCSATPPGRGTSAAGPTSLAGRSSCIIEAWSSRSWESCRGGSTTPGGPISGPPIFPATTFPGTDSSVAIVDLIGRLRSGAGPAAAGDELTAFFSRPGASPWQKSMRGIARPLPRLMLGNTRPAVILFAAASALLLLITCVNVANLLLVQGSARSREVAVRAALGAGQRRVVRQLLAESACLAFGGGALGIGVAIASVRAFIALAPKGLPRLDEIQVNGIVLAGALGITTLAMLLR